MGASKRRAPGRWLQSASTYERNTGLLNVQWYRFPLTMLPDAASATDRASRGESAQSRLFHGLNVFGNECLGFLQPLYENILRFDGLSTEV